MPEVELTGVMVNLDVEYEVYCASCEDLLITDVEAERGKLKIFVTPCECSCEEGGGKEDRG